MHVHVHVCTCVCAVLQACLVMFMCVHLVCFTCVPHKHVYMFCLSTHVCHSTRMCKPPHCMCKKLCMFVCLFKYSSPHPLFLHAFRPRLPPTECADNVSCWLFASSSPSPTTKVLDLSSNQICSLEGLQVVASLCELDLEDNQVNRNCI